MIKVLFVCLGNICRSPMAEAVFQKLVDDAGLTAEIDVESAGTGSWHIGEQAHQGTQRILSRHHIPYNGRARQVNPQDMNDPTTYIIGMDDNNIYDLVQRYGRQPRMYRLLEFATQTKEKNVPDPYYTGDFETVYQLISDGCQGLLATIRQEMHEL